MNLRLILGRAGYGKTQKCLNEIAAKLTKEPDGRPLILLVPEQATFEIERLLALTCPAGGFMRAHVVGFRRLAHRILNQTGGAARPHITELGKRLAISRLLMEHKDELKILNRLPQENPAALSTMAGTVANVIKDFKNYGLHWEQLTNLPQEAFDNLSHNIRSGSLNKKLEDLALIYEKFDGFLKGRYTDPEDYLKLLTEKIPEAEIIKQAEIYLDGFSWFTPQEHAALEALTLTAKSVTVTLCLDSPDNTVQENLESLFNRQWNTRRLLFELAAKLNCPLAEEQLATGYRFFKKPLLAHIERSFAHSSFYAKKPPASKENGDNPSQPADCGGLTIAEAANRRVEAEIISREIIRLSREKNIRFKEMAVLLRNPANYQELMETVLAEYDIPFFSDAGRLALHHPLAELIRSVMDIVLEDWSYEPVFRALKTGFFGLNLDEADTLENYVLEFGIRGKRWTDGRPWTFYRRYSLVRDGILEDAELLKKENFLAEINDIRFRGTAELIDFSAKLGGNLPIEVEKLVQTVYELISRLNVPETLEKWADDAETKGDLEQAGEDRQIWQAVMELLDQLIDTFKGQKLILADFAELVNEGLSGISFNLIPPGLDYVTITDVQRTKIPNIKAAFIAGVNDGAFPLRHKESGLITENDKAVLLSLGLELPGGVNDDIFFEQFLVYTALTRASQYLWVSYSLADSEGEALAPSIVIKQLKEISGAKVASYSANPAPGQEKDYLSTPRKTLPLLANSFRAYKETGVLEEVWRDVYNWALFDEQGKLILSDFLAGLFHVNQVESLDKRLAKLIFCDKKGRLKGSVTRFESFKACPFQHFVKYGLKLKERPVYKLRTPDLGQFLHAVMKKFGDSAALAKRDWGDFTFEEVEALCAKIVEGLIPELQNEILTSSPRYEHLLGRLEKKAVRAIGRLADFSQKSQFKPVALEQYFGQGVTPPLSFKLPDGIIEIAGQIDRVDALNLDGKNYLLIMDYKSGGTVLSLNEVFYGLKLQLATYLLAMLESGNFLPGGMVYCYLKNPVITEKTFIPPDKVEASVNKILKMPGWLLGDVEVIKALDGSLPGNSEFFKIGLTAGGFHKNSLPYLKSLEEFELILGHLKRQLKSIGQNILAGDAAIFPCRLGDLSPCAYCVYQAVCQFDRWLWENSFNVLPKLTDEEIYAKMKALKYSKYF